MLDITVSLPGEWDALEQEVAGRVRQSVLRGKVHVKVEYGRGRGPRRRIWDEAAVAWSLERLAALAAAQGISFRPTPELLWQIANSRRQAPGRPPTRPRGRPCLRRWTGRFTP